MFSRHESIKIRSVDLNALLGNLAKMLRRLLGETIEIELPSNTIAVPLVAADSGMLEQVIVNLCVNARDAMPSGGKITIATDVSEFESRGHKRPDSEPGSFVCLTVSDTGTGIEERVLPRIFEPFFTTKEVGKGTGLGLATVHGIVEQHGGWIEVESEVGKGTTFRVYFPLATEATPLPSPQAPQAKVPDGHGTILLVEDEPSLRSSFAQFLINKGYRILEAGDGLEALSVWEAVSGEVDLLYTDLVLPGNLNGQDLLEQLRRAKPDLKAVITSGYSKTDIEALQRMDNVAFLPKPTPAALIIKTIRQLIT